MRNDFCSNYLEHGFLKKGAQAKDHKYVARIDGKNGLYRYFYDMKEWLAYQNQNKEKKMSDAINKGVDKLNKIYDDILTNNKYATDDYNYDKKIKEVAKTKEWQDIVARKDKEYLKTDKETGKQYMDIDSYLAKKKHPVLDAMDDIVMGRKVTLNKIEKESAIAGAYDYAKTYVTLAAIGTEFLLEKFKFSQGSYKDEKKAALQYIEDNKNALTTATQLVQESSTNPEVRQAIMAGEKFISEYGSNYQNLNVESLSKAAGVSEDDVKTIQKNLNTITKELSNASATAASAAKETKATSDHAHEYIEKIKLPNGEYRYIYEEDKKAEKSEPVTKTEPAKNATVTKPVKTGTVKAEAMPKKETKKNRTSISTGEYDEELNKKKSKKRINSAKQTWKK